MVQEKQRIRRFVAQRRRACTDAAFEEMSARIMEQILRLDVYRSAEVVFAYMDLPGEVRTRELILRCLREGKKVAVPKTEGEEMHFYRIGTGSSSADDSPFSCLRPSAGDSLSARLSPGADDSPFAHLHPGAMGILEPDPAFCPLMDDEEQALVIMPGVAFDRELNRIGYGGGFYDRYLQQHSTHPLAAVAYDFQVFEKVPHDCTDIRPQILVTESGVYHI